MPSHNLIQLKVGGLEIIGYSVAGEETVVAIPQLDVCFDIGKAPDQIISINHCLLTHGHIDHSAGIAYYLSHRNFNDQSPGNVLAPKNLIPWIQQLLDTWGQLDGNTIPANLVGVGPGDEYQIKPNLFARVFPTKHCKGSVGYSIIEKRKKIKPEYAGLTGPQIVELKKNGIEIDIPIEIPIVTYLGDTQYVDYSQLEYVKNSKILIAECTFYETEHAGRADAGKHMHITEFAKLLESLNNKYVIVTHVTHRTAIYDAKKILQKSLPADTLNKTFLFMDKSSPRS